MIHHTPEGQYMELGLNFRRSPGGFCLTWVWFSFAHRRASCRRFRLRLHMKPRVIWSVTKWDVVDQYLRLHDLVPVSREWLEDTKAEWSDKLRIDRAFVRFGPD